MGALGPAALASAGRWGVGLPVPAHLCPPMADTTRVLSDLHADLAYHLKSRLDDGSISTSELNILRQFLKDNGISAQPVAGTGFGDLVASLPDMDKIVQMPRRKAA